jgi:hypothetical protein
VERAGSHSVVRLERPQQREALDVGPDATGPGEVEDLDESGDRPLFGGPVPFCWGVAVADRS